jgi:hypothetical protein
LFDTKKVKLFFTGFLFITRTKNSGKKLFFFIGHEVLFYETTFSARTLSANHATTEAADRGDAQAN